MKKFRHRLEPLDTDFLECGTDLLCIGHLFEEIGETEMIAGADELFDGEQNAIGFHAGRRDDVLNGAQSASFSLMSAPLRSRTPPSRSLDPFVSRS